MKVSATSFEAGTASGRVRVETDLRLTGGTGGRVSGSGEIVDGDAFRHSRELSSCDSDGGITMKIPLFGRLERYNKVASRFQ